MQTKNTKVTQNAKLKSRPAILAAVKASEDLTHTYSGLQQFSTVKAISAPKAGKIQSAPGQLAAIAGGIPLWKRGDLTWITVNGSYGLP